MSVAPEWTPEREKARERVFEARDTKRAAEQEYYEAVREMRRAGCSLDQIHRASGKAMSTVARWCDDISD